jgi:hypothetical protein
MNDFETNRRSTFSKRVSLGGIALILAGLTLIPQGILTANVPSSPQQNLEMAVGANSFNYRFGMTLAGISLALFLLGVFALYAHLSQTKQERVAFAGLIVTVGFLGLFLPLIGFASYVVPATGILVEQGRVEMVAVMEQIFVEPFIVVPFLAGILWNIGNILMGIAIWRSGTLWKWGGLLFILYGVVGIPAFLDVKVFQILATLLGGLALMAVGVSLRRSAAIGK